MEMLKNQNIIQKILLILIKKIEREKQLILMKRLIMLLMNYLEKIILKEIIKGKFLNIKQLNNINF